MIVRSFFSAIAKNNITLKVPSVKYFQFPRLFSSHGAPPSLDDINNRVANLLRLNDKVSRELIYPPQNTITKDDHSSDFNRKALENSWSNLGLDSLDVVEVLIALENEFHLEIPDHVADHVKNPSEAAQYIYTVIHPIKPEPEIGSLEDGDAERVREKI